jgi:hypothetical protein
VGFLAEATPLVLVSFFDESAEDHDHPTDLLDVKSRRVMKRAVDSLTANPQVGHS